MKILGINSPFSLPVTDSAGMQLRPLGDGSAAILSNGEIIFASIEERHTRTRYVGGFSASLERYLDNMDVKSVDVDVVAFSSCCGPKWESEADVLQIIALGKGSVNLPTTANIPQVVIVDHHESHAALGFMLSNYKRALVATIDGFGNLLNNIGWDPSNWWHGRYERNTYFIAEKNGTYFSLSKVSDDSTGEDEIGIGELYSYLTHFCGWNSYQHAGTTMALAAFGNPIANNNLRFLADGRNSLKVLLPNNHPRPAETFQNYLAANGIDLNAMSCRTAEPTDRGHCDIVARVQYELVAALVNRLISLASLHGLDSIVVTGGVALNCLAMGELGRSFSGKVFVPPSPGDTGQALGNAIWAAYCTASPVHQYSREALNLDSTPFWGIPCTEKQLHAALTVLSGQTGFSIVEITDTGKKYEYAARALSDGALVATCIGRAEYGPRALGGRSVLADPRSIDMVKKINEFKKRESFRPYAPSILEEYLDEYFTFPVNSPFMSFAVPLMGTAKRRIPAVVHADGTARVQTVNRQSSSPLRHILECFNSVTGVPVLINTSFNRKGEPMVETPVDSALSFINSDLDVLIFDNYIITRRKDLI